MLRISKLSKEFVDKKILLEVDWFIGPNDKVGLVGTNGAGKTTLMKILIGKEEYESGNLSIDPNTSITYLSQELPEFKNKTLIEEAKNTFPEIVELEKDLNKIEESLQLEKDEKKLEKLVEKYSFTHDELNRFDAKNLEVEMFKVLKGLGFNDSDFNREIGEFSGGWQMRIALAKLLLQKPNLLLLDEPTNHLDISAIEWLEEYLKNYNGAVILISHDRRFLDNIVKRITELEFAKLTDYPGNYSFYEVEKQNKLESLISAKERQDKELKKMQDFVDRFRASANRSTQAKSREKMIAKVERIEIPKNQSKIHFKFPVPPTSGRIVIKMKNLSKKFDSKELFNIGNRELWIERGDKVAIIGPNGSGKTTLMRVLTNEESPTTGEIEHGHNVSLSYFSQNQAEKLNMDKIVIDEIYDLVPDYTLTKVRSLLGRFLFSGEKAFQPVNSLSGGERSRLALAKMLLSPSNLLLLDEPTNHLDINSKDVLISALQEFPETIITISHDRDFISKVCNKVLEINNNDLIVYEGNYDYYVEQKKKENSTIINEIIQEKPKEEDKVQTAKEFRLEQKEKQKQISSLEKNITKLEDTIKKLETKLANPDIYSDNNKMIELNNEYSKLKNDLEEKYLMWEELMV